MPVSVSLCFCIFLYKCLSICMCTVCELQNLTMQKYCTHIIKKERGHCWPSLSLYMCPPLKSAQQAWNTVCSPESIRWSYPLGPL